MGFIDEYKRLEKLCGQALGEDGRVTAYIDAMRAIPDGERYVSTWQEDLKRLKHYRWMRNRIVHEPDCNEKNMCAPEDAKWLRNFRTRLEKHKDPLTLYLKATAAAGKKNTAGKGKRSNPAKDGRPLTKSKNAAQSKAYSGSGKTAGPLLGLAMLLAALLMAVFIICRAAGLF